MSTLSPALPLTQPDDWQQQCLYLSMDYGTKTIAIGYRIAAAGIPADEIHIVQFAHAREEAPQMIAWGPEGEFIWGFGVLEAIKNGTIDWDDVVELWKLALYPDYKTTEITQDVEEKLARLGKGTIPDLIETHLRAIREDLEAKIQETLPFTFNDDFSKLKTEVFLSVPQMWPVESNNVMLEAAKRAGFGRVELVYEPHCAMGAFGHMLQRRSLPSVLQNGDIIHVADAGGGTADFVSYQIDVSDGEGAHMLLKVVKEPTGALYGSEFINREFMKSLQRSPDFGTICERLGLTEAQALNRASRQFEKVKLDFTGPSAEDVFCISIVPLKGLAVKPQLVTLTNQDMESFFKPVIDGVIEGIEAQLMDGSKMILIPGGLGHSIYVKDIIARHFEGRVRLYGRTGMEGAILLPVARGALFRFDHIKVRGYPSNVAFGFGQTEIYDSAVHVDATYQKGVTMANGRVNRHENYPNRQIVKNDPFSDEKTVDHRWVQVMPRGVGVNPGSLYWARKWQYKILKRGETEIELQFYVTTLDLADHDPICEIQEDGRVTLREGINEWGTLLKLQLPNLLSLGFRPQDVPAFGLKDVVEMYYCLGLVNTGGNMRVKCAIMAPGTEPYDEEANWLGDAGVTVVWEREFDLSSGNYNPFPRT